MLDARRISRPLAALVATIVLAFASCGGGSSGEVTKASGRTPEQSDALPCAMEVGDRAATYLETLDDLVSESALVADVTVQGERTDTNDEAPDMRFVRVLLDVSVNAVLKGSASEGDELVIYSTSIISNPQLEGVEPARSDDIIRFEPGQRLILGLSELDRLGERGLIAHDAYFLVTDGKLDQRLADARTRCANGAPKAMFREAEDLSVAQLQDRVLSLSDVVGLRPR